MQEKKIDKMIRRIFFAVCMNLFGGLFLYRRFREEHNMNRQQNSSGVNNQIRSPINEATEYSKTLQMQKKVGRAKTFRDGDRGQGEHSV